VTGVVVDTADFETVGPPATAPANSVSVTSTGADPTGNGDSTNAFNQALATGRSQGRVVWIPPGNFRITSPLQIDSVTLRGAGPWYSVLRGTHLIDNGSTAGAIRLQDFAAIGEVTIRNDGSPDNFVNGSLGNGSVVSNIWIQHQKVGLWLVGPNNGNLTIENSRFLDLTADGLNFNGTVTNSVVRNNYLRNTGDDALAMWSLYSANVNNTFANNTIVQPNLANGIAIYGGTGTTVSNNVVADTNALGSGIAISNQQFIAGQGFTPLAGAIGVTGNVVIRGGALNPNWGHAMGAIRVDSYDFAIGSGVSVAITGGQLVESPYTAIEIVSGGGTGLPVSNLTVDGVSISDVGTTVLQVETGGTGTFRNVVATGTSVAGVYNCAFPANAPAFTITLGGGNSSWPGSVWPGCTFPSPGSPPPTTPPPPPPGTNVALNRPASASGHQQDLVPARAVDGDPNSYWESTNNAFPQTFTVDLGAAHRVNRVTLRLPPVPAWGPRTQTATIRGSTDGSAFTDLVGSRGYQFDPASGNTATVTFGPATVRFVQLWFTANTGWPACQLSELQVITA
jgi:Alpha-1,3-glucanase catalytic domain D2/NedA-like, galactose-binding domain